MVCLKLPIFLLGVALALPAVANDLVFQPEAFRVGPADISCVIDAARRQKVPANVLLALASMEGGKNGQRVGNSNESYDIGHFQLNSIHWKKDGLFWRHPEIREADVAWRGCYNAEVAAWVLRKHIEDEKASGDYWTRVANYHSKTKFFNSRYRSKLIPKVVEWGQWLSQYHPHLAVNYID